MTSPPPDLTDLANLIMGSGRSVRLGRGVVGKTGHVWLALLVVWLMVAAKIGPSLLQDGMALIVGVIATIGVAWWTYSSQRFAAENPAQAMLEGAEFLEYQRFNAEVKGGIYSPNSGMVGNSETPQIGPPDG